MRTDTRTLLGLAAALGLLIILGASGFAQEPSASEIPESDIAALIEDLGQLGAERSSGVRARRDCKNVIDEAEELLEDYPDAPNRFQIFSIILQSQKRLLTLDNSDRNRDALFETCTLLADAPDEYAKLRLEADLLLSDRDLTLANADLAGRAEALEGIIENYRGTPAESKSLMMAMLIAPKIEAFDLEREILNIMDEHYADDPGIIEFRRKHLGANRLDVSFQGTFQRTDGGTVSFPTDRIGHLSIAVFWSKDTPGFGEALRQIDANRETYPGLVEIFSFNLDELPDGGQATLESLGLGWTTLLLPGGKQSQTFRTYGHREPVGVFINSYGHALVTPTIEHGYGHHAATNPHEVIEVRVEDARPLAQLQSLSIGDFLVSRATLPDERAAGGVPPAIIESIQACLVEAPFRYRLTEEEALANYEQAVELTGKALAQHPDAPDLWVIRNRRIIAQIGIWKLTGDETHLLAAGEEAGAALSTTLPAGAEVVPQFCLAKQALRQSEPDPEAALAPLVATAGGTGPAAGTAHAALAILALDLNSPEVHDRHRGALLENHTEDPALWTVLSFLRDRYHTYHLLEASYTRAERGARSHLIHHGEEVTTPTFPEIELKKLDGGTLSLPQDGEGKLTLLMFVEPPADPEADFPLKINGTPAGEKTRAAPGVMQFAFARADLHIHGEVEVIAAFLSDDAERVSALMESTGWACQAAMVPGGLENPMVQRLGILSADRIPNVYLLRRDGTVAWTTSGLEYKSDFGYPFAFYLAMKLHIEVCDTQLAYRAMERGDHEEAARLFAGPFPLERDERFRWRGPRFHGRALANMALEDWEAALVDIDTAIEAHTNEFDHAADRPCASMIAMHQARATILEALGQKEEAEAAKEMATVEPTEYSETIYEEFHQRLTELGGGGE